MRKVLLLGPSRHAVSGVSTHLNQLLGSRLASEFELCHFQIGSEGRRENSFQKLLRFVLSPLILAAKIVWERPDIVHINTSLEPKSFWRDAVYLAIAKMLFRKVVYQVHGGELPEQFFGNSRWLTLGLRYLLRWPDAVVLLASVEYEAYRKFTPCKHLTVIANAIELPATPEKSFDHRPFRLGFIGRLADNKGAIEAIQAVSHLQNLGIDDVYLTIAGSGPSEDTMRALVESLALQSRVTFAGALFGKDKDRFWRDIDLFVFPTFHREGLPYTVLESLAYATPLITTSVGGIADAIVDGVQGYFVAPRDPEGLARKLKELIDDRETLKRMSEACVARAREFYGIDRLASQFSQLYRQVLR